MARAYLCPECVAAGVTPGNDAGADDLLLVACSFCGAINEQATYVRNAVDVHDRFGTLADGHGIQFREILERKHEEFVDSLLDAYLVDPASRVVERPAGHFKAGVKTWYNRYRQHEREKGGWKAASTNNQARKVKYLLAVAIHVTILESNVVVVNNRLAHFKPVDHSAPAPAARGDGTLMAPSLKRIFATLHALPSTHIGNLDSYSTLTMYYRRFKEVRGKGPSAMEITLAQAYVISQRIQLLTRLPHATRLQHLVTKDLKPAAARKKKTVDAADIDDFILGAEEWRYMSIVDWASTLETAYHLYRAQQVVALWGNRCYIDISVALLQWAIMATTGTIMPSITVWSEELSVPHGGSGKIVQRRREELKNLLIGWMTSFPDAGIPVPLLDAPRRGTMGNGLMGYGSDKRRPVPEMIMATAAAPIVTANWRQIMQARLRSRTDALPLDTEYTMAAKMLAQRYNDDFKEKKRAQAAARKALSAPGSRRGSRAASSGSTAGPHRAVSQPLRDREQRTQSPSIEAMLATRDDSSDEDGGRNSDEDVDGDVSASLGDLRGLNLTGVSSVPFGFSIGPRGFSVAADESTGATVHVHPPPNSRKRARTAGLRGPYKRAKRNLSVTPMSPPPTSPSSQALSPAATDGNGVRIASPTPSLRSITMSPSLTAISASEPTDLVCDGVLARERSQYAYYNRYNEQRRGALVSAEVETAMLAWLADAKATGLVPERITPAYLASIGVHGDPRTQDLGPYLRSHPQWSATEALLRAGLRPAEFPAHLVVHSLLDLEQQLGRFSWEQRLTPSGETLSSAQLDEELHTLFALGPERWEDQFASPREADRREQMYLKAGVWSFPRDVAEGPVNRLDGGAIDGKRRGNGKGKRLRRGGRILEDEAGGVRPMSRRIDYAVLDRLVTLDDEDDEGEGRGGGEDGRGGGEDGSGEGADAGEAGEEAGDEDEALIEEVLHETLWSALELDDEVSSDDEEE